MGGDKYRSPEMTRAALEVEAVIRQILKLSTKVVSGWSTKVSTRLLKARANGIEVETLE
jgi:hypothetical protein